MKTVLPKRKSMEQESEEIMLAPSDSEDYSDEEEYTE